MDLLIEAAKKLGPIKAWRVMVLESDARISHKDFADLKSAQEYASDAEAEWDENRPIAKVLDRDFKIVTS